MSSANTSHTGTVAARTSTSSTPTYMAPPSYAPSDASSMKSTSSTVKKHLVSIFNRKLKSSSMDVSTTKAQSGEDSLTTEEKKARNEARASYFSTLG